MANPGLARAVAEVTQPFGAPVSGDVLRSLQKYLQDKKSIDNVYKALVLRAWAEPLSQAVFDKVVSIFKQCLLRHTPSLDVLELLDEFCTALPRALPLPPSSMKAVQYAQACVCRAYDNCVAQAAASQQRPQTAEKKLAMLHERPPSASRLPPRGKSPSLSANLPAKPPTPSILANVGAAGVGAAKQQPGAPGLQVLELHSRPSTAQQPVRPAGLPGYGGGSGNLLRRSSSSLDSEAQARLLTTPPWAAQGAATLVGLLDQGQHPMQIDSIVDTSWVGHVPELNPSLTPAPYGEEPALMLLEEESELAASRSTAAPMSATSLARCILDVDEERVEEHLTEVALALKAEVQLDSETKGSTAARPPAGRNQGKTAQPPSPVAHMPHAHMLFSHQPYSTQEELSMSQADVAVVVEVVCGQGAAKAFGAEAPGAGSGEAKPWCQSFDEGDLGQVCGSILMKLVIDLFLNAGPGTSYPLVLRMLRQSLASSQQQVRARAFDVIFNLAFHSALLEPLDQAGQPQPQPPEQEQEQLEQAQPPQQQEQQADHEDEEERGKEPPLQDQSTKHGQMMCWLRALCMQLLSDITEADESSEEVWQAALGCYLDLTTFKGHIVEAWAIHTPLNAMSGLLCACAIFGWSPELHAQLLRLASTLLVKHTPSEEALARAAAAANRAVVEAWAHGGRQQPQQPKLTPRLGGVPEEFGGLQEVLRHLSLAPTPAAQADMLGVILHYLSPDASVLGALTRAILTRGLTPFTAALQAGIACPRPGGLALRLGSCLAGGGHASYGAHGGFPSGHARNHSQGRGLYFGGNAGYGYGGSSLVGAGSAPNPSTGNAVSNWLSLEAMRFNAGGAPHNGSMRGNHYASINNMNPGALPLPIEELLLAFLTSVEEAAVLPVQLCMKQPEISSHITVTLEHIAPSGGAPAMGQGSSHLDPNVVAAAWDALKAACMDVDSWAADAASAGGDDDSQGAGARRRRLCASMTRLPASGGQLALHWLHQVLLQAFLVCQSAPLLMAPSTLRSPTSARLAMAGTFGSSLAAASQPHASAAVHESPGAGARAAAAAAIAVRATSPGSVFGSPAANLNGNGSGAATAGSANGTVRGAAGHAPEPTAQRPGSNGGSTPPTPQKGEPPMGPQEQQHLAGAWTCKLAGVLTHVMREVPCGGRLLVAAMARVVSDLKQGIAHLEARIHVVMAVHQVTLMWLLQSGSNNANDRQQAVHTLCDQVLHSLTQPLGPGDAGQPRGSRSGAATAGGPSASQITSSMPNSSAQRQSFDDLQGAGAGNAKPIRSHHLQVSYSFDADSASTDEGTSTLQQLNYQYGHSHIASTILTSQAGFVPDVLRATPPELLVGLLQHCVRPNVGGKGQARGFLGRTNPSQAYANRPAQQLVALVDSMQAPPPAPAQPPPTWSDVAMDRRLALLLALMACCGLDPDAFARYGLSHVIKAGLMSSTDPRERYYAGVYLLRHLQLNQQDKYWRALRALLLQAQQLNDERMIDNPYLTAASMLSLDS